MWPLFDRQLAQNSLEQCCYTIFFLVGIKVLIKVAKKTLNLILALGLLLIAKSIKKLIDSQLPE